MTNTVELTHTGIPTRAVLSSKEAAQYIGVSHPTLERWRADGEGPAFIKLGARRIGYRISALDRWLDDLEEQTMRNHF